MPRVRLDAYLSTRDGRPIQGADIYFYYRKHGEQAWNSIGMQYTDENGHASIITELEPGAYDFRAEFPGNEYYAPSEDIVENFVIPGVKPAVVEEEGFPWWLVLGLLLLLLLASRRRSEQGVR